MDAFFKAAGQRPGKGVYYGMKQFLLREAPGRNGLVRLRGEDYHYLVRVRRTKPGDHFTAVLPGGAGTVTLRVTGIDRETLTGTVLPPDAPDNGVFAAGNEAPRNDGSAAVPVVLLQALPRGTKMDLIVRQAAEGGAAEVVPFVSERSVFERPPPDRVRRMEERWRRIVREARQQSGSPADTRIHPVMTGDELFAYWESLPTGALGLVCRPGPLVQGGFHRYLYREPSLAALAVGPEGGFSPAELDRFTGAGFKPVSLGNTVLRTETAALYGAAALRIILMERAQWTLN